MFTDPLFRTAVGISLLLHVIVFTPVNFMSGTRDRISPGAAELNYVIDDPRLAEREEIYSPDDAGIEGDGQEGDPAPNRVVAKLETCLLLEDRQMAAGIGEKGAAYLEYYNLIREKIRARIHDVFERGESGVVVVTFTLDPAGRLQGIESAVSGPSPTIRQKTLIGIKKAQPFPPFPEKLGKDPISFFLTVNVTAA